MKIVFVLESLALGGGNYVICQHAMHARRMGHDVALAVASRFNENDALWHPGLATIRLMQLDAVGEEEFDIAVATYWRTALRIHGIVSRQYCYFVQSIESLFYEESQIRMRQLVERTYQLGLSCITEATWIRAHLTQKYGSTCYLAKNGIRKDLYTAAGVPLVAKAPGKMRILVEGGFGVSFKNTSRTLRIVKRANVGEIFLLTSSDLKWFPGVRVFSRIPINEVGAIYRSCDVIVKLSLVEGMFGPPLEMFHCGGTAVVYNVSGYDEYIVHDQNALVASINDEGAVVKYLRQLRDDSETLERLKAGAEVTAESWPDWPEASDIFLRWLEAIFSEERISRERLAEAVAEVAREYSNELGPSVGGKSAVRRRWPWSGWVRMGKDRLKPYMTIWRCFAEGYR